MCQSQFNNSSGKMETKKKEEEAKTPEVLLSQGQPYFKNIVGGMKLQLALCTKMSTIPFEWDYVNEGFRLLESKRRLLLCKIQIGIHVAYTALMIGYFFTPGSLAKLKPSTKMVGYAFLVCFGATMMMRLTVWSKKKELVHLINNFFRFENTYLPQATSKQKADGLSRMLMTLGVMTSVGLPGTMCMMLLASPCKPPHLGYILFQNEFGVCQVPHWIVRVVLLTFDTWMWLNCISAACSFGFLIFFPGLRALVIYLGMLRKISKEPIESYPGSTPRFKSLVARDHFSFRVYRHIQMLAKLYNFCLQMVFIPTQISAACAVLIIGLYTCIKLRAEIPMPGFAFFPLISSDGFAMILISQVAAGVYTSSTKFVVDARNSRLYKRKSFFVKTARATSMIKIRFGSTNFIDKMTPLVYLNFCISQTVQLILLS